MISAPPGRLAQTSGQTRFERGFSIFRDHPDHLPGERQPGHDEVFGGHRFGPKSAQAASQGRQSGWWPRVCYWVDDDSCKVDKSNTAECSGRNDPIATGMVSNSHLGLCSVHHRKFSFPAFPEISALSGFHGQERSPRASHEYAASHRALILCPRFPTAYPASRNTSSGSSNRSQNQTRSLHGRATMFRPSLERYLTCGGISL